jgi:hypothetical protein
MASHTTLRDTRRRALPPDLDRQTNQPTDTDSIPDESIATSPNDAYDYD